MSILFRNLGDVHCQSNRFAFFIDRYWFEVFLVGVLGVNSSDDLMTALDLVYVTCRLVCLQQTNEILKEKHNRRGLLN